MPDQTPIRRIVNTLLFYAIAEGAKQVHLVLSDTGKGLRVVYLRGEEREQKMILPMYVQKPLFDELRSLTGESNSFNFSFRSQELKMEMRFEMQIAFTAEEQGGSATISLHFRGGDSDSDEEEVTDLRF